MWTASNSADPVRDFGAISGTNVTTPYLQARDKAQNNDVPFLVQSGVWFVDQLVEFVKPIDVIGATRQSSRVVFLGESAHLKYTFTQSHQFHDIRDVSLIPSVVDQGTYGLEIVLANAAAAIGYFNYHRLNIGPFGLRGMVWNNTVPSGQPDDGFYVGSVEDSFISNGMLGVNIGDSLVFNRVKFHGRQNVTLSGVPGQREIIFRDGQITTRAGFLQLNGINGVFSENQWMEHPTYLSAYEGDPNGAAILLNNVADAHFNNDTIGVHSADQGAGPYPAHVFALVGATKDVNLLDETFLNRGWASHVYAPTGVARVRVPTTNNGNKFNGIAPAVVLQGPGPYWT